LTASGPPHMRMIGGRLDSLALAATRTTHNRSEPLSGISRLAGTVTQPQSTPFSFSHLGPTPSIPQGVGLKPAAGAASSDGGVTRRQRPASVVKIKQLPDDFARIADSPVAEAKPSPSPTGEIVRMYTANAPLGRKRPHCASGRCGPPVRSCAAGLPWRSCNSEHYCHK